MDRETINKYKERFELGKDNDVPNAVAFKAMTEGMKKNLRSKLDSTHRQITRQIELLNLEIEQPLPFSLAEREYWSEEFFAVIWKEMVAGAASDSADEIVIDSHIGKTKAGTYVLGLLQAAIKAEVIKSTMGGWPANFETPELENIEDGYRSRKDQYPSGGLKFSAKNKGTLQLHLKWR